MMEGDGIVSSCSVGFEADTAWGFEGCTGQLAELGSRTGELRGECQLVVWVFFGRGEGRTWAQRMGRAVGRTS
jgi:hypothetical protein